MNFTSPILAATLLPSSQEHTDDNIFNAMKLLKYPVLATLKLDGVRAIRLNGSLLSRTLKKIPNVFIREQAIVLPGGADMELWSKELDYNDIQSIVMSKQHDDETKICYHLLDCVSPVASQWYEERCQAIINWMKEFQQPFIKFSPPQFIENAEQLWGFFRLCEEEAGEGICFRLPNSPYKQGRSTLKEQYLVKLARYSTGEARIVGFEEQMENLNVATRNSRGLQERSHHAHNLHSKDTLGALIVEDLTTGLQFKIGTGFDDKLRSLIWHDQDQYLTQIVTYKCKQHGVKVKPRCPSFRGFRQPMDII